MFRLEPLTREGFAFVAEGGARHWSDTAPVAGQGRTVVEDVRPMTLAAFLALHPVWAAVFLHGEVSEHLVKA